MSPVRPAGRDLDLLRALIGRVDQQDSGAFNNLGVLYHARGLHAEAVDAFLRALALDPRMRTAARNLEIAATQPDACSVRMADLDARVAADPDDRAAARERARLARLVGHTTAAIQQLDTLIAADPDDAVALFERGLIEQRAGDLRRAQRWFERAVNVGGGDTDARLHLAEVLYQRGQNEQALDRLDALLAAFPGNADAHLLRGFVLGDMGRHDAARDATRRAAQLNPSLTTVQADLSLEPTTLPDVARIVGAAPRMMSVEAEGTLAHYGLGLAFRQRGYFDEARREFERSLANGEDPRLAQHALAELDLVAGAFDAARERYDALLAREEQPRLWNEHGVALHQSGRVAAAADSYRAALRCDPRSPLANNNLGVALYDLGDVGAARESFLRAAEFDPTLVVARLNLARWCSAQRDPLAALALLRELVAFHPRDADAWQEMGTVLQALHRPEDARDALLTAIECRPAFAEARFALGQVLAQLGDADGAARETEAALRYAPVRMDVRMAVGIDLQRECPDAVGGLTLLTVRGGEPLRGTAVADNLLEALLPEQAPAAVVSVHAGEGVVTPADEGTAWCDEADRFAARALQGEALDRYARARERLDATGVALSTMEPATQALWQRAALGEARCLCLLGRGGEALPVLKRAGAMWPQLPELLALFAGAAVADARRTPASGEVARTAMLRLLRLDVTSAALLHFAGDAAMTLGDDALALAFYRRALAHDAARPTARVAIARMLRQRGDLLAARLELVAALTAVPNWRDAVIELARVHHDAQRYMDARWLLVDLLRRVPTDRDALLLLAEVLIGEARAPDARVVVDRMLRHDADFTGALWCDGVLLAQQARMREAMARWTRLAQSPEPDRYVEQARHAVSTAVSAAVAMAGDPARVA